MSKKWYNNLKFFSDAGIVAQSKWKMNPYNSHAEYCKWIRSHIPFLWQSSSWYLDVWKLIWTELGWWHCVVMKWTNTFRQYADASVSCLIKHNGFIGGAMITSFDINMRVLSVVVLNWKPWQAAGVWGSLDSLASIIFIENISFPDMIPIKFVFSTTKPVDVVEMPWGFFLETHPSQ